MSGDEPAGESDRLDSGVPGRLGAAEDFPVAVATGVVGGVIVLVCQYALWALLVDGPLAVAGAVGLEAEMALFVAIGVALPAGGIALLYADSPSSGVAGAGTVLLGAPAVELALSLPPWQFEGVVGAAAILALVALLERATGSGLED